MQWQFNPFMPPLLLSAMLSLLLAAIAWRRRPAPGAVTMALLMLALCLWSLAYSLELSTVDLPSKTFWAKVQYLGFLAAPALWLVFVLQYTGQDRRLTPRLMALLAAVPLVTLALVVTTEQHGLIYAGLGLDTSRPYTMLEPVFGPAYYVQGAYAYLLFLAGIALILLAFSKSPPLQRGQFGMLLLGAPLVLLGNIVYVMDLGPPHLDLAPFALTLTGLLAVWSLFRYRFLDILPVARDALIEGMSDGVIVLDWQGRIADCNLAAQTMLNHTVAEVVGRPCGDVVPEWPQLERQVDPTGVVSAELTLTSHGLQRFVELRISPLYLRHNTLRGWLLILRDISDRKRAEQAEREQRALAEALRDAIAALTSTLSLDEVLDRILQEAVSVVPHDASNIMLIEDGVARMVRSRGYVERGLTDYVKTLRLPVLEAVNLRSMVETQMPLAISDTHESPNWVRLAEVDWLRSYAGAPIVIKGAVIGFLNLDSTTPGFYHEEHAQRLQAFANQAGIAILNARLYSSLQEANAQLQVAVRAREEMIQNVSHELRTPLTVLQGYVEMLESRALGELTSQQDAALHVMQQQTHRLRFMVNSLLVLQTFGKDKLIGSKIDVCSWLPPIVATWAPKAEDNGIHLHVDIAERPEAVIISASHMELVVDNLLDNAIKFSPNGGDVLVRSWQQNGEVIISVTDTGIGIPFDQQARIFEPFYQVDGTMTRRFRGMGIGLSLCQAIVEAHGGRIWVESSAAGKGSTFFVGLRTGTSSTLLQWR